MRVALLLALALSAGGCTAAHVEHATRGLRAATDTATAVGQCLEIVETDKSVAEATDKTEAIGRVLSVAAACFGVATSVIAGWCESGRIPAADPLCRAALTF